MGISLHRRIDRARLAEKSARKDEKTLFWPPPTWQHYLSKGELARTINEPSSDCEFDSSLL